MNKTGKDIVNTFATQLSLHDKSKEELEVLAQRYSYFAFAQFLLYQKMKDAQDPNTEKQMQKTALYFSNPFLLYYLITANEWYKVDTSNESLNHVEQTNEELQKENITAATETEKTGQNINKYEDEHNEDEDSSISNEEHEKLSRLIEQHLSEFKKPLEDNGEIPLETRVYHTIDYFASQGIKLEPGKISQDMLGTKVKKFTDWLKQIKQTNQNPTDLGTDTETEHLIEKIAQTSNEAKDVVTETMAQVLLKQGKTEKAIQLYKKLSFLNPSKSTYFAAKINDLKASQ